MSILKIKLKGQKVKHQKLEEGQEYWIGRDKKNAIVTPFSHGISRKHLKITQTEDQQWKVECVSKLGGLVFQSQEVKEHILSPDDYLYLKDYTFHFVVKEENKVLEKEEALPEEHPPLDVKEEEELELEQEPEQELEPEEKPEEDIFAQKYQSFEDQSHVQKSKIQEISDENEILNDLNHSPDEKKEDSGPKPLAHELRLQNDTSSAISSSSGNTKHTDSTKVDSQSMLQPTLIVSLDEDEEDQTIPLEGGHLWVIGREPSCDICIEDHNISRQHFEIKRDDNQKFYITDLGSSNGTCLNDKALEPNKPHLLESGSVINILEVEIYFDIINKAIQKAPTNLPAVSPNPHQPSNIPIVSENQPLAPSSSHLPPTPNVIMDQTLLTSLSHLTSGNKKKRLVVIGLVLALVIGAGFFMNTDKNGSEEILAEEETQANPEQEKITDLYNLAQQLYQMKKYELCYEKLNLLHTITPYYEQSLQLIKSCKAGADNQRAQLEIERRNKEQEKVDAIIAKNTKECKEKFSTFDSLESLQKCLAPTMDHDPQHPDVWALISKFEDKLVEKKRLQEQQQARARRRKRELAIYNKAKKLKDENRELAAIKAYKKFLKKSDSYIIQDTVAIAQQELTDMETELNNKINTHLTGCRSLSEEKKYKEAYVACKNVLTVMPGHAEATETMNLSEQELHIKLKPLYEESVINESLGNIDEAKKFWNNIISQDIPNGKYASKAQLKLSKY